MDGEGGRRVDVAGRKKQDTFFGGLLKAHDVADATENVRIAVSRIWTIALPSQLDHFK